MNINEHLGLEKYVASVEELSEVNLHEECYYNKTKEIYVGQGANKNVTLYCKTESKRLLVVIGESWTYGDNLKPHVRCVEDKDNIPYRVSTIFAGKVATYLKSDLLLNSQPGNCNINHYYRLREYIDTIKENGSYDEVFLIFQLTSPGRDYRNNMVDEPIKHLFSKTPNQYPVLEYNDWQHEYDKTYFNLIEEQVKRIPFKSSVVWKNFNEFHYKGREQFSFNVIEHPFMRLVVQMSGYDFEPSKNMEHTFYENLHELYNLKVDTKTLEEEIDKQNKGLSLLGKSMLNNFHPNEQGHWFLTALIIDKFKSNGY